MGKNEAWLVQVAIEEGTPLPKSILNSPILDEITTDYYKAFGVLSRARGFTDNGISLPITFEAVNCYSNRFGIEDFEDFLNIISGIDDAYLKIEATKRKRDAKAKKRKDARKNSQKG